MTDKAKAFAALHRKGDPVVLYNIWDAGSAKAVAESGAKALATEAGRLPPRKAIPMARRSRSINW